MIAIPGLYPCSHNCVVGNHVIMSNCAGLAGHVTVEDRVVIGGIAGVHQFVKIGRNSMIGGLAKVVQDIPPLSSPMVSLHAASA